jgi:hypothetical protein
MPNAVLAEPQNEQESVRPKLTSLARIDVWFPAAIVLGVLLLGSLGISGSSAALLSTSGATDQRAVLIGNPKLIRTDEYRIWTPIRAGRVEANFPGAQTFGLGREDLGSTWRPQIPSRSLGALLYAPWNIPLVTLPLDQGFAFSWWLPVAGCFIGVYAWLRAMRISSGFALATAVLAGTSPAAVWWSNYLVQSIACATIPAALVIAAARTRPTRPRLSLLIAVAAGLSSASLPWFYQPWAIIVSLFVFGVTLLWGVSDPNVRRAFLVTAGVAGAVFLVEQVPYVLHERSYYEALGNTVYPGDRRELGGGVAIGKLFSSVVPFSFSGDSGRFLTGRDSVSGLSMGWTIAMPVALTAALLGWRALRQDRERVLVVGVLLLSVGLSSWTLVKWPSFVGTLSFLRFVPPYRLAPFVGFFGLVSLALLFGVADRRARLTRALGKAGISTLVLVTGFVAAWGVNKYKHFTLPSLSSRVMLIAVVVIMLAVLSLCTRLWAVGLGMVTVLALLSGASVNPLMRGLGELTNSTAAATVRRVDTAIVATERENWAADSGGVIALLNAQGVNSLSSFNDPVNKRAWRALDTQGRYEPQWNRFGYIVFHWEPGHHGINVENPAEDVVLVRIDPCDSRLANLGLRAVVSSQPLDGATCLSPVAQMRWMGTQQTVYMRAPNTS